MRIILKISHGLLFALSTMLLVSCSDGDDQPTYESCSIPDTNNKLFSLLQDKYFWNEELPAKINPEAYESIGHALYNLRNEKDRFSFTMTREEYDDYANSVFFGYGFGHQVNSAGDGLTIRYVFEDGSAAKNGLRRGDVITKVGDVLVSDFIQQNTGTSVDWTVLFGPNVEGHYVDVTFKKPTGEVSVATFTKGSIVANTVMAAETKSLTINGQDKTVAYMVFDSFKESSQTEFNTAFEQFDNVDEMILDLRYNSGGVISTANQLSTQIAGRNVDDEIFVSYKYNQKQSDNNEDILFTLGRGIKQLDLDRLVVLTTETSCSASELVINALSPFIDVTVVGDTTCGKPIGMRPEEVCEHVVFAINFQTHNAAGFGDYFDGLPADCAVAENVTGDWGDENDPLLAEGLSYLANNQCSSQSVAYSKSLTKNKKRKDVSVKEMMLRKDML